MLISWIIFALTYVSIQLPSIIYSNSFYPALSETVEAVEIAEMLKIYHAYDSNGPIVLRRFGKENDGGYVIPEIAIQKAEFIFSYGLNNEMSFEEEVSLRYKKQSFGFDCTCPLLKNLKSRCHFVPSCIIGKNESPGRFSKSGTFDKHLNMVGASRRKLFVKMDIEGNEYNSMPDVLQHADNITGIVLEMHFSAWHQVPQALCLLQMLDKEFLLVHIHGNNYCKDTFTAANVRGSIPRVLELSYINRSLIERYEISPDQTHPTPLDMPNAPGEPDAEFTILN